jgi:NAD(P)-dependent dehydrogenase (short-subunit alcohol dehydrogenase family)
LTAWIDLNGRAALITGAGGGIGLATAQRLAGCGARVAINDINAVRAEKAAQRIGNGAWAIAGDVSHEATAKGIVEAVAARCGGLNILVNNAGISEPTRATIRQDLETWRRTIDVNLQSVFLMSRAAAGIMGGTGGAIVNVASITGLRGFAASNGYGVSKAGVAMMTQTMACELARHGIRVNAVAPGIIDAPMAVTVQAEMAQSAGAFVRRTPLGRVGSPDDVARAIAFLASDWAAFITGVVLPVDGGWCAFGGAGDAARPNDGSVRAK